MKGGKGHIGKKGAYIFIGSTLLFLVLMAAILLLTPKNSWHDIEISGGDIVLSLPNAQTVKSDEDKIDHNVSILLRHEVYEDPRYLVSVKREMGLRAAASMSRMEPLDMLLGNIERAYPMRFSGYHVESEVRRNVANRPAADLVFTYENAGKVIRQRLLLFLWDGDTAYFVTAQARAADFDELNTLFFNRIFASVRASTR
jgi:hypothetical protein